MPGVTSGMSGNKRMRIRIADATRLEKSDWFHIVLLITFSNPLDHQLDQPLLVLRSTIII